jgi:hypothetical protein
MCCIFWLLLCQTPQFSLCLPSWVRWSALSADLAQCSSCLLWDAGYVLTASCLLLWSLSCLEAWILSQTRGLSRGNNPRCVWHPCPMCTVSSILDLFFTFLFHFADILFYNFEGWTPVTADRRWLALVYSTSLSSCSLTRQDSGDQLLLFLFTGFFTKLSATSLTQLFDIPSPCQTGTLAFLRDFHPG